MTYEALARKFRPRTFAEVVEQPQVTQTLQNAIATGRIHHAYLFCGPRGTGKTTTARLLAKALNCETGPTPTPCNECAACNGVTNGSSLDVLEIDAASNTGVDNIRDLRESARYVPASSRYKIYIIDEVHQLSPSAFDALLKTLEEPPPSVIFILATTEPNGVPATVRSRTLRLDFHLISHRGLHDALSQIAQKESLDVEDGALDIIATEATGSLRDGQSLLDQLIGYAGGKITTEVAYQALGLVDASVLFDLTGAFAHHDPARALEVVADVSRAGRDFLQFVKQLTEHIKRLLFARSLGARFTDDSLNREALTLYTESAKAFDEADLLRLLMMSIELGNRYKKAAQPRLETELFVMRCARMDRSIDIRQLVERIEGRSASPTLFNGDSTTGTPAMAVHPAPPSSGSPRPPTSVPIQPPLGRGSSASRIEGSSSDAPHAPMSAAPVLKGSVSAMAAADPGGIDFAPILSAICRVRPTMQAVLGHAELVRTGPGSVDLNVYNGSPFHQMQLKQKPIRDLIHAEISRVLGEGIRVSIHVKDGKPSADTNGSVRPRPAAINDETLRADHNLQEILRRFDGEIVG